MDDLIDAVEGHAEYVSEVSRFTWIFDTPGNKPDPRRVAEADTMYPIIFTQTVNGSCVVLDGLHRLSKAVVERSGRIRVKFISEISLLSRLVPVEDPYKKGS